MGAHNIWVKAFITSLSNCGNVRQACKDVGIDPKTAYRKREKDSKFKLEWAGALDEAADVLEQEAWRRAHDGVEDPVYYKGDVCGTVRKYSDLLLMFLLKGMRPEKFREKVYISTAQLDQLIERELATLKGEGEEEKEISKAVN